MAAYAEYAAIVKREVHICLRLAERAGLGTMEVGALGDAVGLPLLQETEQLRADLFEAVLLLGNTDSIEAARRWQEAVWKLHETVNGTRVVDQSTFMALFRAAGIARDDFHTASRASLPIVGAFARSREYATPIH